jgi:hypothetical protein
MTQPRLGRFAAVAVLVLLLAGCVNREGATLTPGAELSRLRSFHVVKLEADNRGIERLIAQELQARGYTAGSGTEAARPVDTDALVTYSDRWAWDITMYMLSLDITVRDGRTGFPMAVGSSLHTSLTRQSPTEMVREALGNIFRAAPR